MPGLTGAEVVEALQRRDPAVKVVMLTGSAMEGDVARVRERGVTVLAKPVFWSCPGLVDGDGLSDHATCGRCLNS
jgi:CheY-like chemotaxis protein